MSYATYDSYRDSGVAWLGNVPEHWEVSRLKYEVTFNDETLSDKTDLDYEILYVDISSVSISQGITHKELMTFENSPSRARRIVRSGDVIISTVRTYLKAIAQINHAEENLIVSTGFAVLRHKAELSPKFLGYWVQSENMINAIVAHSVGVSYPAINATDLVRLPIVKIPLPEQTAIADYLDNKLGEIDALISKQETLLEKLAEQRTAIITHAVTKGLNAHAPMKNSGVAWLGNVPEHWEVSRLKYEVTFNDETLSDKTDLDYEILYVDISSVSISQGITHKELMTFENSPSRARRIVRSGDVIISTVRTYLKAIAQINHAEENLIVSTGFAVLRHKAELSPKFLGYWVQSENMINAIVAHSVGVSYPAINATDLVRLPIVKIPLPEQTAIANYLDEQTAKIDRLSDTVNQTIARLKEYRSALITQAVTGKIKVI